MPEMYQTVLRQDSQGYILNADGAVVPTVHQHDRLASFFQNDQAAGWLSQQVLSPKSPEAITALDKKREHFVEW